MIYLSQAINWFSTSQIWIISIYVRTSTMAIQFFSLVESLSYFLCSLISLSVKINSLWVKYKMTDIKMKSILIIQKIYEWMAKYKNGRSDAWSFPLNAVSPAENLIMLHKIFSNNSVNYNTPLPAINLQTKTLNKETQRKLLRWHNVYCWNFTAGPILNLFN